MPTPRPSMRELLLADHRCRVARRDVADLVPEHGGELGLGVEVGHEPAGGVDESAGQGERVDGGDRPPPGTSTAGSGARCPPPGSRPGARRRPGSSGPRRGRKRLRLPCPPGGPSRSPAPRRRASAGGCPWRDWWRRPAARRAGRGLRHVGRQRVARDVASWSLHFHCAAWRLAASRDGAQTRWFQTTAPTSTSPASAPGSRSRSASPRRRAVR